MATAPDNGPKQTPNNYKWGVEGRLSKQLSVAVVVTRF